MQRRDPRLVLVLLVSVIVFASAQIGNQRQSLIRPLEGPTSLEITVPLATDSMVGPMARCPKR